MLEEKLRATEDLLRRFYETFLPAVEKSFLKPEQQDVLREARDHLESVAKTHGERQVQ